MNKEEKKAIEYLKTRLYGNKGCKYIDVAQEDLRIFINLVNRKEKDIEGWKKYCEEIEEEQTEMSNKNCELKFEVEKLQKENIEQKAEIERRKHDNKTLKEFVSSVFNEELNDKYILTDKQYNAVIENAQNDINQKWIQKVKDKIEEEKLPLTIVGGRKNKKTLEYGIKLGRRQALQELIEEREKK